MSAIEDRELAVSGRGRPSDEELLELTRQVTGLARDGLPLGPGLKALAQELPRGQLRGMIDVIVTKLDAGVALGDALAEEGSRFPGPLRGLIVAGARSGKLAEALGKFLDLHDLGATLGRQLRLGLIYPLLLLMTAFAVFISMAVLTTNGYAAIFADFGINLPWITVALIDISRAVVAAGWWLASAPFVAIGVLWAAMRLTLGPGERQKLIQSMPMIGPLSRDSALAHFCPVLAILIESEIPLGEALVLAGDASKDHAMADAARAMAGEVAAGRTLGEAMVGKRPIPKDFGTFVGWAQRNGVLVDSLRVAGETFEDRARNRAAFLARFCNACSMAVVFWWVALTVVALFLPMLQLMGNLAGGGWPQMSLVGYGRLAAFFAAGLLCFLGAVSLMVLVWPALWRAASIAGLAANEIGSRRKFAAIAFLGMSLFGLVVAMHLIGLFINWQLAEFLPPWWLSEIWPELRWVEFACGVLGLLIYILAMSVDRRRKRDEAASGKESPPSRTRVRWPAWRFGLRHMMFAMAPLALVFVVARDLKWSLPLLIGLLSPPLLLVSAYLVLTSRKSMQRDSLLRVMAMASRVGQPLGPAVRAFAATCTGSYQRKVAYFAHRLEAGDTLATALDLAPSVLSKSGEVVARVGHQLGTLPRMLEDAVASIAHEKSTQAKAVGSIAYPIAVAAILVGVGSFLFVYIGPAFVSIFNDFEIPLPEPTRTIFAWLSPSQRRSVGVEEVSIAALALLIGVSTAPALIGVFFLIRMLNDAMPMTDRFFRRRTAAVILRAMAAGVETGQELPAILDRLAVSYPRPWVLRRLASSSRRVDRGEDWCDALRSERLILAADAAVLRSAQRAGNLAWAMRETAGSGERRLAYRLQAMGQLIQPLLVVTMGGFVLVFALTYFSPLVSIINSLTRANG